MKTTEEALQHFESLVLSDVLPTAASLVQANYENLLDARDMDAFAAPWTEAYNFSTDLYNSLPSQKKGKARVDKVREHVFKRVYQQTEVSDLASYISDDFDLVLKHLLTDTENDWVNALWLSYKTGEIPNESLEAQSGNLRDLI